jgi:hypothetical protein
MRAGMMAIPIIISVILIGAVVMFATNSGLFASITGKSATQSAEVDVDALIKQGKFAKALNSLKATKQAQGLSPEMAEKYDQCCVAVARQYMKDKKFPEAITLLQQVGAKSSQSKQAKDLIKKS